MSTSSQTNAGWSVAVLGAGLAGLVAAYELAEAGYDVIVLEAKTRAGGHALTLREPFADGLHAEAGAKFVPENHELTMGYAQHFGLKLTRTHSSKLASSRSALYYVNGDRIHINNGNFLDSTGRKTSWPLDLPAGEQQIQPLALMTRYCSPVISDATLFGNPADEGWPSKELLAQFDHLSFEQFLRQRGATEPAIRLMRLTYISLAGEGIGSLNALWALRELYFVQRMGDACWLEDGTDSLPEAFARYLGSRIRFGAAVTRIDQRTDNVRVSYMGAGEKRRIETSCVVCALPFSVLRGISIAPALSEQKRRAVDDLPYTEAIGVYLQTRTRFWEDEGLPRVGETDLPITYVLDTSWYQPGTRGILTCLVAGANARSLGALSEDERQAAVLTQMETLYPGIRKHYEGGISYDWARDPFARGAYSWMRPGQFSSIHPHIATPEGRIFFAGEHASPWPAWMQGALWSGRRAAAAIIERR